MRRGLPMIFVPMEALRLETIAFSSEPNAGSREENASNKRLSFQNNGVNVAAVVRLLAMHRASVAETARIGIGVDADVVDDEHAGIFEPLADEAGEVDHRMAFARGGKEEQGVLRINLQKPFDEFVADFVGVLADQGTDRGDDVGALCAQRSEERRVGKECRSRWSPY